MVNCKVILAFLLCTLTVPSSKERTPSCSPISRTSMALFLKVSDDVRATTLRPGSAINALRISSDKPSEKKFVSLPRDKLVNGMMASVGISSLVGTSPGGNNGADSAEISSSSEDVTRKVLCPLLSSLNWISMGLSPSDKP